jgi:hypothetical protein
MSVFKILDGVGGNVINTVVAEEDFVSANYDYYEIVDDELTTEQLTQAKELEARTWRDSELVATDQASQTPDWPNRDNILTYRADLRDWPSTADFPDTSPTLGS